MRVVFGLVLVLGLGLAGFAVIMVKDYMGSQEVALQQERARAAKIVEVVEVVAASTPLAFGDSLTMEDVVTVKYAKEFLPEGTFATVEDLFPDGAEVVRSIRRPLEPNEVILAGDVTAPGEMASITQELDAAMRAFTIRVDASTGVSGFLRPGDRVDIYWTGAVDMRDRTEETHLIGSSIQLVAVDQSTDRNLATTKIPNTVTVQVSPDDVARLAQAQADGRLSLALVGKETAQATVAPGEQAIFLPEQAVEVVEAPALPAPTAPQQCYTTVRRGTESAQIEIACAN